MRERPILFSGPLIPPILADAKTMTRRVIKLDSPFDQWVQPLQLDVDPLLWTWRSTITGGVAVAKCRYGQVGDRLWVRETWMHRSIPDISLPKSPKSIIYKATNPEVGEAFKWKPSIFMPRWASRILLEITEVRVERVQEITPLDAVKEGCPRHHEYNEKFEFISATSPIDRFHALWDSINPKYPWESNCWVWVVSFKRVWPVRYI